MEVVSIGVDYTTRIQVSTTNDLQAQNLSMLTNPTWAGITIAVTLDNGEKLYYFVLSDARAKEHNYAFTIRKKISQIISRRRMGLFLKIAIITI